MQLLLAEQELVYEEDESYDAIPICGGNFQTPVIEPTYYLDELTWTIGGRTYVDNAD